MISRRGFGALLLCGVPAAGALTGCMANSDAAQPRPSSPAPPTATRALAVAPATPSAAAAPPTRPGLAVLDDYPWPGLNSHIRSETSGVGANSGTWGMVYGGCVSFAAWKIYEDNGGLQRPPKAPDPGWFPTDGQARSPVRTSWGGADTWDRAARSNGYRVDTTPRVGSFAMWHVNAAFPLGFVAYVTAVHLDGSIDTAQYNLHRQAEFSVAHLPRGGGVVADGGQSAVTVGWPEYFLHISANS